MLIEYLWNNNNENFTDNLTSTEKITIYFLIGFYFVVTLLVAYYRPINLFNIFRINEPKNSNIINKIFSIFLALFMSIIFWIVKVLEFFVFSDKFKKMWSKVKSKVKTKTKPKPKRQLKSRTKVNTKEIKEIYIKPPKKRVIR